MTAEAGTVDEGGGRSAAPFRSAPVFLTELAGPDLVIVSATPDTGLALGTGDATLIGRSLADILRGPGGRRLVEAIREVYLTGNHAHDVGWSTPSGSPASGRRGTAFSLSVMPVCQRDGSVGGVAVAGLARASHLREPGGRSGGTGNPRADHEPAPAQADAAGLAVPPGLPVLPRVRLAARLVPARRDPGAGKPPGTGNAWIDAVVLPQQVIGVTAGTAGDRFRTVPGAAARLRALLSAAMCHDAGPAQALARLNDLATGPAGGPGATAWVAQLDPATGDLRYAGTGHALPMVCARGGETTVLPARGSATSGVPPGAVLVLCPAGPVRPLAGDSPGRPPSTPPCMAGPGWAPASSGCGPALMVRGAWLSGCLTGAGGGSAVRRRRARDGQAAAACQSSARSVTS